MEKNTKITAEWARKTANEVMSEKVKNEVKSCEAAIVEAVKKNEFSCSVSFYGHELTKGELERRGFKVSQYSGDQRDGSYMTINW